MKWSTPACTLLRPEPKHHRRTDGDHPRRRLPTAGIIYGMAGVRDGYRTGRGRCDARQACHFEDIDKGARQAIIVDEIPYQVNKKTLLERIAELVHEKKIEGISHIRTSPTSRACGW